MPVIEDIRSRGEEGSRALIGEGLVNVGQDVCRG